MAIALGQAAPMTNEGIEQKVFCLFTSGLSICIISLAKPVSFLLERIKRWVSVSFVLKWRKKSWKWLNCRQSIVYFLHWILTRKVGFVMIFTSETSEKIHNSTFQGKIWV